LFSGILLWVLFFGILPGILFGVFKFEIRWIFEFIRFCGIFLSIQIFLDLSRHANSRKILKKSKTKHNNAYKERFKIDTLHF
jgi:hypothetical protein